MFLSQPPMPTRPSKAWALATTSTLSAMTSRLTRLNFMPSVPMLMPSLTVGAPKMRPTPPLASAPRWAVLASSWMCMLQGVMSLKVEQTPTMGFLKSASSKPTARSMARLGMRWSPCVTRAERRGLVMARFLSRGVLVFLAG